MVLDGDLFQREIIIEQGQVKVTDDGAFMYYDVIEARMGTLKQRRYEPMSELCEKRLDKISTMEMDEWFCEILEQLSESAMR